MQIIPIVIQIKPNMTVIVSGWSCFKLYQMTVTPALHQGVNF